MNCQTFERHLQPYLEERLDRGQRTDFREHLKACDACRSVAVAADSSFLMLLGSEPEIDGDAADLCAQRVSGMIRQERLRRRMRPKTRAWMAAAAALVIGFGTGVTWKVVSSEGGGDVPGMAVQAESPAQNQAPPPTVDVEMPDSGVRVYQFAGSESDDTAVVFVVNEEMEL